jgi:hypothetical protein
LLLASPWTAAGRAGPPAGAAAHRGRDRLGHLPGGRQRPAGPGAVVLYRDRVAGPGRARRRVALQGTSVRFVGRLQQRAWTAEDASARSTVEVVAEELGGEPWVGDGEPCQGQQARRGMTGEAFAGSPIRLQWCWEVPCCPGPAGFRRLSRSALDFAGTSVTDSTARADSQLARASHILRYCRGPIPDLDSIRCCVCWRPQSSAERPGRSPLDNRPGRVVRGPWAGEHP